MASSLARIVWAGVGTTAVISALVSAKALTAPETAGDVPPMTPPTVPALPTVTPTTPTSTAPQPTATGTPATPPAGTTPSPTAQAPSASGSFTGKPASTRYGNVQVAIDVSNGQITDVRVLQVPTRDPQDRMIAQYAVPILTSEALAAQSAQIDSVSGATYTSDGYKQSLQSAIDQAGL